MLTKPDKLDNRSRVNSINFWSILDVSLVFPWNDLKCRKRRRRRRLLSKCLLGPLEFHPCFFVSVARALMIHVHSSSQLGWMCLLLLLKGLEFPVLEFSSVQFSVGQFRGAGARARAQFISSSWNPYVRTPRRHKSPSSARFTWKSEMIFILSCLSHMIYVYGCVCVLVESNWYENLIWFHLIEIYVQSVAVSA